MSLNKLTLTKILKCRESIEYFYYVEGEWKDAFQEQQSYFVKYDRDMTWCPDSIAVIPFLGNFLPISWVFDAEIVINEVDEDFLYSIDEIKSGYQEMYPAIDFKGSLSIKRKVKNSVIKGLNKSLLFFSGGVDATASLISTLNEEPMLVTLLGSDIFFHNIDGWNNVKDAVKQTAEKFSLPYSFIKTSFRSVINYNFLNERVAKPNHENWWHGFQHGIVIITHSAPLAYLEGIKQIYIASTDSIKGNEVYTCASFPTIDNNVRFCGCKVLHEGFENSRADKVRKICSFSKRTGISFFLRVCWMTLTGKNCCICEKCMRTLYAILAEGFSPEEFGFPMTQEMYQKHLEMLKNGEIQIPVIFWADIIKKLSHNQKLQDTNPVAKYLVEKFPQYGEKYGVVNYPTRISYFSSTDVQADDVSHKIGSKVIMFKSDLNLETKEKAFQSVGMNTGNQVFSSSLEKILNLEVSPWNKIQKDHSQLNDIKAVVTTDLIWINQNSNFDYLYERLSKVQTPFVPISIGLQAGKLDPDFRLNSSCLKVLSAMQERAILGVRGEYTASILEKHGITNISIIGCPSLYWTKNPDFQFEKKEFIGKKVLCNFRTFYGNLTKSEKHYLTYCANRNYTFVEQTSLPFLISSVNDSRFYNYINNWLIKNTKLYFDTDSWRTGIRGHDFSFGGRFHGNVICLWENIPALFLTLDSRTQELTDFFHLPSIRMEEFDREKPIDYYYELADYSEFNRHYKEKYLNFREFLRKNNLCE